MTAEEYLIAYARRLDEIDGLTRRIGECDCKNPRFEFDPYDETGKSCIRNYREEEGHWPWKRSAHGHAIEGEIDPDSDLCDGCVKAAMLVHERRKARRSLGAFKGAPRRKGAALIKLRESIG